MTTTLVVWQHQCPFASRVDAHVLVLQVLRGRCSFFIVSFRCLARKPDSDTHVWLLQVLRARGNVVHCLFVMLCEDVPILTRKFL